MKPLTRRTALATAGAAALVLTGALPTGPLSDQMRERLADCCQETRGERVSDRPPAQEPSPPFR